MRYALLGFCLLTACGEKVLYLGELSAELKSKPGRSAVGVEPPLQLLWTHKMDGSPLGGALFAGDLILQLTTEPTLYALNRRNGTQLGKHGYDKMACAPGQLAEALYALGVLGRKPSLRVLDRRTATERWQHEGVFCQVPVVRGDTLIAVDEGGSVQALRLADGHVLWRAELGGLARTGLALSGDLAIAGTASGDLVALNATSGKERWRTSLGEAVRSRPVPTGAHVVAATASGRVLAARRDSGRVVWERALGALPTAELALAAGVLVVGCADRLFYGLDAATGEVRWTFATEGVVRSSPAATEHTAYGASSDGHLYALDLQDGHLLWKYRLDGPVLAPVSLGAQIVAVATEKRLLYVFGRY